MFVPRQQRWIGFSAVVALASGLAFVPPDSEVKLVPLKYDKFLSQVARNPRAKYTIVDAWATWCGPCKENFPHLVEMHARYAGKGLAVASISFDNPADSKAVAEATAFLKQVKAGFTNVLLDEEDGAAFELFDLNAIPAVFLYGPDGKEVRRFTMDNPDRQFTYEQVEKVVNLLLEGKPIPANAPGEVYQPRKGQ